MRFESATATAAATDAPVDPYAVGNVWTNAYWQVSKYRRHRDVCLEIDSLREGGVAIIHFRAVSDPTQAKAMRCVLWELAPVGTL